VGRSNLHFQLSRFAILTCVSATVTVGVPILLREGWQVSPKIGAAIAFALAFLINFVTLRKIVFDSPHTASRDLIIYAVSTGTFRLLEYAAFVMLLILHVQYVLALVSVLSCSAVAKFVWYRHVLHKPGRHVARSGESQSQMASCSLPSVIGSTEAD
jgi:putative flippase GtrA